MTSCSGDCVGPNPRGISLSDGLSQLTRRGVAPAAAVVTLRLRLRVVVVRVVRDHTGPSFCCRHRGHAVSGFFILENTRKYDEMKTQGAEFRSV